MFVCAVAQLIWDSHANRHFDGKIGIWPFIFKEPSKISSKNCTAGTMETTFITSINQVEMTKIFVDKVVPEIKQKWHVGYKCCNIQQENSKPHTTAAGNDIVQALQHDLIQMELSNYPPNIPDLKFLDLVFSTPYRPCNMSSRQNIFMTWSRQLR